MKKHIPKLLTLLFVLCTAITANAGYITQSGTFSNGGTWKIEGSTLYIDAEEVPNYTGNYHGCAPWCKFRNLHTVEFSSKIRTIGTYAFWHAEHIHTVIFKDKTKADIVIGVHAFDGCYDLHSIDGRYITSIQSGAFANCYHLQTLVLPNVNFIGRDAFDKCASMYRDPRGEYPSIWLTGNKLPTIKEQDQSWYNGGYTTINYWSVWESGDGGEKKSYGVSRGPLSKIIIAVKNSDLLSQLDAALGAYSYYYTTVGGSLSDDENNMTFYWCMLQNHYNNSKDPSRLYIHCYKDMDDYSSASATPWNAFRTQIKYVDISSYPDTYIGKNAFSGMNNLEKVFFDGGKVNPTTKIAKVGESAFANCTKLSSIDLSYAQEIGKNAFASTALSSTINLSAAQQIADNAFDGVAFKEIAFGDKLQNIGQNAFRGSFVNGGRIYVFSPVPSTSSNAFQGANTAATTLYLDVAISSGYSTTAPWNSFKMDVSAKFPVGGTWGHGYGTWMIDTKGTLIVKDGGSSGFDLKLPDYANESDQPWYLYRDYIKKVDIEEGLKGIGKNAFATPNEGESQI
ncbi:MAG: leucine-rich repeat protein, partial [Alphaproteobacteria bacterium]|nr:leucine-rich repeat protein [Alphaproteobacteria bacterium]